MITKEQTSDLGCGSIVKLIQNDESKAKELVEFCYQELTDIQKEIKEAEKKLNSLKFRESQLLGVPEYLSHHLQRELPIYVVSENSVIVIGKGLIESKTNVICQKK